MLLSISVTVPPTQMPPPSLLVRSEQSLLAQVIALAHTAGVHDVQVAYEPANQETP